VVEQREELKKPLSIIARNIRYQLRDFHRSIMSIVDRNDQVEIRLWLRRLVLRFRRFGLCVFL
jgi:hypothetical protein